MMKQCIGFIFSLCAIVLAGCGSDSDEGTLTLPSDITIETSVNTTGTGEVSVVATATNVNFYTFFFGDVSGETGTPSTDGKTTHKYTASGTYTITVQAHATPLAFASKTTTVTVVAGNDGPISDKGYTTPSAYDGMTLVWNDEFSGTTLNAADWTFETGTGSSGWGNNELQYYRTENTSVKDGYLVITAKKETFNGSQYTSSRIKTQGKRDFKYGRIDMRALLPKGQGIWPALWMLGSNITTTPWPGCGEIDMMEMVGGNLDNTVHGTVHWADGANHASYGGNTKLASGIFNDEFHVFTLIWTDKKIAWLVDDVQFNVVDTTPAGLSEFQEKFFLIFNVAVGGNWPGSPNASTVFPQRMVVDYVRVFQ